MLPSGACGLAHLDYSVCQTKLHKLSLLQLLQVQEEVTHTRTRKVLSNNGKKHTGKMEFCHAENNWFELMLVFPNDLKCLGIDCLVKNQHSATLLSALGHAHWMLQQCTCIDSVKVCLWCPNNWAVRKTLLVGLDSSLIAELKPNKPGNIWVTVRKIWK